MPAKNPLPNRSRGFSLIELLVVVVIIGLIMAFAVPAANTMLRGTVVFQSANSLTDEVSRARQYAVSKNKVVEVRFYKHADPDVPGESVATPSTWRFRAFQWFEIPEQLITIGSTKYAVPLPVGKQMWLKDSVIISSDATLSSLLGNTPPNPANTPVTPIAKVDPPLTRGVDMNYTYASFRFFPDGTTNLSKTALAAIPSSGTPPGPSLWFLTVQLLKDDGKLPSDPAPKALTNFATWMIDPVWGTTKTLRPGQ